MNLRQLFEFTLLAALWGASFLFMRVAAPEFGAIPLIEIRVAIAGLALLPVLMLRKQLHVVKQHAKPIFLLGLFNSAIPFCLFAYASITLTAGYTSVTNATAPLWTALLAAIFFKDKLSNAAMIGLLIGFGGVLVLVWEKLMGWQNSYVLAISATLIATLCYGIGVNYTKHKLSGVSSLAITAGSLFFAAVQLLPLAVYYWPETAISMQAWLAAIGLSLFCTGVAYLLFFRLLGQIGLGNTITVTYLIPVFGSLFGYVILDEQITDNMLIGGIVILLGTAVVMGIVKLPRKAATETQ